VIFPQTWEFQQLAFGLRNVLGNHDIVEQDTTNIIIVNAAGRGVLGAVLARGRPEVRLGVDRVSTRP
jgi:hypothetical protein